MNDKKIVEIPLATLVLGLGGLIPFLAGACGMVLAPDFSASIGYALITYAAVILSFLGGIVWGLSMCAPTKMPWRDYSLSIVPSLVAWAATMLPQSKGLLVLCVALVLWFLVELWVLKNNQTQPFWYLKLRLALTVGASLSLFIATFVK